MTPPPSNRPPPKHTATAAQACLLLDIALRPLLTELLGAGVGGVSVGELTAALGGDGAGWNLRRVHYQVGRLEAAGIACEVGREARAGRAIRRFAIPAPWFIPFEVTEAETLEGFLAAQIVPRTEQIVHLQAGALLAYQPDWGLWLRAGSLHLGGVSGPPATHLLEGQPFISSMGTVRLRPERALELKQRLWALLGEFREDDEGGGGAADYTLSLQLVRGRVE